jgi:hypothetical protein
MLRLSCVVTGLFGLLLDCLGGFNIFSDARIFLLQSFTKRKSRKGLETMPGLVGSSQQLRDKAVRSASTIMGTS